MVDKLWLIFAASKTIFSFCLSNTNMVDEAHSNVGFPFRGSLGPLGMLRVRVAERHVCCGVHLDFMAGYVSDSCVCVYTRGQL
jgi:hypothetical protein